jgi:hypothetical protein
MILTTEGGALSRYFKIRPALALPAVALALGVVGCGVAHERADSVDGGARDLSTTSVKQWLKGDGDNDSSVDGDSDMGSDDQDSDTDGHLSRREYGYGHYDYDDEYIRRSGRAASMAVGETISSLVERYYRAASAEDGATACSMIYPTLAAAIPGEYGQASGPAYLRGALSCPAVMLLLFKHFHNELTAPVTVTGVRVKGPQAYVLLGSSRLPASDISVERVGSAWKIDGLLGDRLP